MELLVSDISDDSNDTCKTLDSLHAQSSVRARAWLVRNREGLSPINIDDFMQKYDTANTQRRDLVITALNERSQLSATKIDTMIQQLVKAFDTHLEAAAGKTKAHFKWIKQQYRAQVEVTRQANKLELRDTLQLDKVLLSESVRTVTMQGALDVQKQAESYSATMAAMRKSEISMQQSVEVANLLKQKAEAELQIVTDIANERIEQMTQQINELQQALAAATAAETDRDNDDQYRGRDSSVDSYYSVHSEHSYSSSNSASSSSSSGNDEHERDGIRDHHYSTTEANVRDSLVCRSPKRKNQTRPRSPKHKKSSSKKQQQQRESTSSSIHRTKRRSKQPSTSYSGHASSLAKTLPTPKSAVITEDVDGSDENNDIHNSSNDQHRSAQHRKRKRNTRPASAAAATTVNRTSLIAAQQQQHHKQPSQRTSVAAKQPSKRNTYSADRVRAVTDSSLTEQHEQDDVKKQDEHAEHRPVSFTSGYTSKTTKHKAKSVSSVKRHAQLSLDTTTVAPAVKAHVASKSKRHTTAVATGGGGVSSQQQYSLTDTAVDTDSKQQQQRRSGTSYDDTVIAQEQQQQQLDTSSTDMSGVAPIALTKTVKELEKLSSTANSTVIANNNLLVQHTVQPQTRETKPTVSSVVTGTQTEQKASSSSGSISSNIGMVHDEKHDTDAISIGGATTDVSSNNPLLLGPVPTDTRHYLQHLHSVQAAATESSKHNAPTTVHSKTTAGSKKQMHTTKASVSRSKTPITGATVNTRGDSLHTTTATPATTIAAATDAAITSKVVTTASNIDVSIEEALAAALRNAIISGVVAVNSIKSTNSAGATDARSTNANVTAIDDRTSSLDIVKQRSLRWLDHTTEGTQCNDTSVSGVRDVGANVDITSNTDSSTVTATKAGVTATTVTDADIKGKSISQLTVTTI
jgi:hypothetical protein